MEVRMTLRKALNDGLLKMDDTINIRGIFDFDRKTPYRIGRTFVADISLSKFGRDMEIGVICPGKYTGFRVAMLIDRTSKQFWVLEDIYPLLCNEEFGITSYSLLEEKRIKFVIVIPASSWDKLIVYFDEKEDAYLELPDRTHYTH